MDQARNYNNAAEPPQQSEMSRVSARFRGFGDALGNLIVHPRETNDRAIGSDGAGKTDQARPMPVPSGMIGELDQHADGFEELLKMLDHEVARASRIV